MPNEVGHAVTGQRRAREPVNLVLAVWRVDRHEPLDHFKPWQAVVIEDRFSDPLRAPVVFVDLITQPRCFAVLVEANTANRIAVGVNRKVPAHRRPQAGALDGQNKLPDRITVFLDVDLK